MTTTAPVRSTAHDSGPTPAYARRGELPFNLFVEEYDLVQKVRGAGHRPHLSETTR